MELSVTNILNTERILLRALLDVHKYALQEKSCRYQPWGPNSEKESQAFVNQVLADATKNPRSRYVFAIINKGEEKMVGAGELNIRDFNNKIGEIAYIVHPDYWGKGIATTFPLVLSGCTFIEHKNSQS